MSGIDGFSLVDDPDDPAKGTLDRVDVSDQSFETAIRVKTDTEPSRLWDVMLSALNETDIETNDTLLATFSARCVEPPEDSSECRFSFYFQEAESPCTRSTVFPVRVGENWTRFAHPFLSLISYAAREGAAIIMLGYPAQTVEIADFSLQDFGDTKEIGVLENTPFTYEGREEDASWRTAAEERIEQYRKGDLVVQVEDASGKPVSGASVSVEMTRHAFGFGTALDTDALRCHMKDDTVTRYTDVIQSLFNTVVFENTLKWPALEEEWGEELGLDTAIWGIDWADDLNLDTRGHALVWPGWDNLPASIESAYDDRLADDGEEAAKTYLRQAVEDHVQSTVSSLSGRLDHWDVLNEPYDNHDLMDILGRDAMLDWFNIARSEDSNAKLFVNDYSIIAPKTTYSASRKNLIDTLDFLIENDAPVDGIGVQAHFQGDLTEPDRVLEILDELAAFDREIWITEFDISDATDDLSGDYTRDFLTALFSHPKVGGFVFWGFWDGAYYGDSAPLYNSDWSEKPAAKAYKELLDKWHTSAQGVSDDDGRFTTSGFFGDYEIAVKVDDTPHTTSFQLTQDETTAIVVIQ